MAQRLSLRMKQTLRACAAGAVWRPLHADGLWHVDTKIHAEPTPDNGAWGAFLYEVAASTARALEKRGLVQPLLGHRECPHMKAQAAMMGACPFKFGGVPNTRVRVATLRLTDAGRAALQ